MHFDLELGTVLRKSYFFNQFPSSERCSLTIVGNLKKLSNV